MSITVFQIHNVLRTYDYLVKGKPAPTTQKREKTQNQRQETTVPTDPVTISKQSRKRLTQDQSQNSENEA